MNPMQFIAKWQKVELKERSAAQEHFLDLCRLLGHPTPAEADPTGEAFCFEKGISKHDGGDGFADVWKKDFFGWEYKGKHKDLGVAYNQLLMYRDALANPPLLVVCDLDRLVVHTNFEKTVSVAHEISLDQLGEPRSLEILRAVFENPEKLRPGVTSAAITQAAAQQIAGIAQSMRQRGLDAARVAHFLDRVVFCLFAEDIGLLPEMIFTRIMEKSAGDPAKFSRFIGQLFEAMGHGGEFGMESIRHFDGNLFDDSSVLELTAEEIDRIVHTTKMDWSAIDPSILGTLFERGLDPSTRAQLGAHYTSREDIETLVEPVVMQPLRREWTRLRASIEADLASGRRKARESALQGVRAFLEDLAHLRVLDPACGSGNFLYVTLQKLKDLEKEVIIFANQHLGQTFLPLVSPEQLYGLEINAYAHELAQMTIWIGWLQWIRSNGFGFPQDPILRPLAGNFRHQDAILDLSDPANPKEPEWPEVDCIVGNPPFLGDKMMRRELGDDYVDKLRSLYQERIPGQSDLCCYWFERTRAHIVAGKCRRAGLLATQGIRGGANREVLKRIKESGDIFWAISDKDWVLDGANVHVSMVGFDDGNETGHYLNEIAVSSINPNLSSHADITTANALDLNLKNAFLGSCKGGPFDISEEEAISLLQYSGNPHGLPNSDVLRPVANSEDLLKNRGIRWIVDSANLMLASFCLFERPYELIEKRVKPLRDQNRDRWLRENWWRPQRMRPEMRSAVSGLERFIITPTTAKHRLFIWMTNPTLPDHQLIVFARSDDYFFGVLHSRPHEVWALAQGTQLREKESGFRYTPTTCFETFPFPNPTPEQEAAIAAAAKELNDLRERWLNPPEWTREEILKFPGSVGGPWDRYLDPTTLDPASGIGRVLYPRLVPKDEACAAQLKQRTLTNLYNARPAWLDLAHRKLDAAVFAAYGWPPDLSEEEILAKLLELNLTAIERN